MNPLTRIEFHERCPEIKLLLNIQDVKYTSRAYGWSDNTLLMYKEENDKHMFYMCRDKTGNVPFERRYIYYIKPNSFDGDFKAQGSQFGSLKIPLDHSNVHIFKDPFIQRMEPEEKDTVIETLNLAIEFMNSTIKKIEHGE